MRSIILFWLLFCVCASYADGYIYDHFLTADPSQPVSEVNAHSISDALNRAYSYPSGNTLITAAVADFAPFVVDPQSCSNRVVKVVGTRVTETQMTTVIAQGGLDYLAYVSEGGNLAGNVVILENIRFQGGTKAFDIHDINEMQLYIDNCIFAAQETWVIDSTVPFSVTGSKFELSPTSGCTGAVRISGADSYDTELVATISGNVFTGKFLEHVIQAGTGEGMDWHFLTAVNIEGNTFDSVTWAGGNYVSGNGAVQTSGVQTVNINRNLFNMCSVAGSPYPCLVRIYDPHRMDVPLETRSLRIVNNTFLPDTGQNGFSGMFVHMGFHRARIINNVICNMNGTGIGFDGTPAPVLAYAVQNNDIFNCGQPMENVGTGNGWTVDGQIFSDPLLDTGYQPIWNNVSVSPCIDAGNRDTDGDGIVWNGGGGLSLGDPDDSDADRTPLDMGAVTSIPHQFEDYAMPEGGAIKWMSFPVVNDITAGSDINSSFFAGILDPSILEWVKYKYGNQFPKYLQYTMYGLENGSDTVSSLIGYKIKLLDNAFGSYKLSIPGFLEDPGTQINLYQYQGGTSSINENWIGYFHNTSSHPFDAFSQVLDKVTSIRTQYWSMAKNPKTGVWLIPPGNLTLNYGDMVIVTVNQDCSFTWNNAVPVDPKLREQATAFTYEEKPDYTPMYVNMDLDELPDEIGVYVDGECKGAVIVDDNSSDICVYLEDGEAISPENSEIVLYYANKCGNGLRKVCRPNADELAEVSGDGLTFYTLDISNGAAQDVPPNITELFSNYPNPFNPSTLISYELAGAGYVCLSIFNLKGQLIKTLAEGFQDSGYHRLVWDGKDDHGDPVASGIYYCRLTAGKERQSIKMVLVK